MSNIYRALYCAAAAVMAKLFLRRFAVSWRIDENTHRGMSFSEILFWPLLIVAVVFLLLGVIQRLRTHSP